MPYNVTQTYTYTGDSVFDSAGAFKAWYHAVDSDFIVAVETATQALPSISLCLM